ncbi:hypothetical protein [Mycolicibacterium fortuitum]|uniref:Uncharacterized protein n=1 Tax=Mycolicibacterium fortuitum TaxID=1766 RepID=A0AAE4V7B6_MYCFO|nr:hypothetical protein [Mycolicibacterium fortuitum]MDV7194622.1 hypothetical protein [Mycolicibacterium fortuitum]MDV7208622.1 hypothetical protein [Mycolicibacterium fortuitum]MDV7230519.1 hypothetical protein [Mycolicibacterium fortuitum]MDV7261874.1 hypothetical protein [Mycolicibacterium fortuitum]MDV7287017.1 hypothetical protein [Mycolicibacterium fortuitum]
MARIAIIVNGTTVMDANVSLRSGDLPNIEELLQPLQNSSDGEFKPWLSVTGGVLGMVILESNLKGSVRDTTITVTSRPDGGDRIPWGISVDYS